jgi:hypothetical protein
VTELVQPLAGTAESTEQRAHVPSFAELVYAHYAWWHALREPGERPHAHHAYERLRERFEEHHGRVVHAFWCTEIESAVALTERPRRHRWWDSAELAFHRESDWATKAHPEVAAALHKCDELAVRAQTVLTGVRRRICLHLVAATAGHLLSLVDTTSGHENTAATTEALKREEQALADTEAYYKQAANGQAQIAYFAGMAAVTLLIALVSTVTLIYNDWTASVAALIAGSCGAVVSVVQRINAGDFDLDYDVGRPYAFFLGGLRPLIGGAFALAISFAFTSGIAHLPINAHDPDANRRLALLVVSFVAGFSERWAQDTLATATSFTQPEPKQQGQPEPKKKEQT